MDPRGVQRAHPVHAGAQSRAHEIGRIRGGAGPDAAGAGEDRSLRQGRRAHRVGRSVRGDQGVPGGLLDRRGRDAGACRRDRGAGLVGAGSRRSAALDSDRASPGHGRAAAQRRMTAASARSVEHLLREITPQVLGALTRRHRDFAAAEDAVQEALVDASMQWPLEGVPENPAGWLYRIALRRLSDQLRSEAARRRREKQVAIELADEEVHVPPIDEEFEPEQDDTLVLLFMCSHPSLTAPSAIALMLRAVGGLTTREIGAAFFISEATMAQRISRAKQTIKESKVAFSLPSTQERAERLDAVMHVLYLIFNEGYASSSGATLQRVDLSSEAIRLTRALSSSVPDSPEAAGLLALMLLTDARRLARTGSAGELIPLDEQDRALWDKLLIQEG